MESYRLQRDELGRPFVEVPHRGSRLINHPLYNKGTAFSEEERDAFGLRGLLPPATNTMQQQAQRATEAVLRKPDPLERYIGLAALHDRDEHLFYRVLLDNLEAFLPIVYTPTVGLACQQFSRIFRRARGLWITPADRGRVEELLGHAPYDDVRLIVVTDNERILGLGDQGAGGMGIPVGKLALYSAAGGVHPAQTLPVSLDVGTDNPTLLNDPLYLGHRQPRLRGPAYEELVDEFVQAVQRRFPRALLQWEDFKKGNAFHLLDRYRDQLPSFNDDIQGTAAVALACVLAVCRQTGRPLREQRIVIVGSGAAGIGIARQLRSALTEEGLTGPALAGAIAVLDSRGLLVDDGPVEREPYKAEFLWSPALSASHGLPGPGPHELLQVIEAVRPTVLIGTSGTPGLFSEACVRALARHVERPAIFPFSNPTEKAEATPADLLAWTDGRALVATGSPFQPVELAGRVARISQGNNVYVFPGLGLGVLLAGASVVDDRLFGVAARVIAEQVPATDLEAGALLPPIRELRTVSARIAAAVLQASAGTTAEAARVLVQAAMWEPEYPRLTPR